MTLSKQTRLPGYSSGRALEVLDERLLAVCDGSAPGDPLLGCVVAARDLRPVDDVPPGGDVVRPAVLVLQVVGVLPDVDAEDRGHPVRERSVLIGGRGHLEDTAVRDEPRPAASEPVRACVGDLLLEGVES